MESLAWKGESLATSSVPVGDSAHAVHSNASSLSSGSVQTKQQPGFHKAEA